MLSLIAGVWFVLGPAVSLTWESAICPIGRPLFGSTRQMLELIGYFYGLGALIVALSAYSLGRVWTRSALPAAEAPGALERSAQEPDLAHSESQGQHLLRRRRGQAAGATQRPLERQR